MARQLSGSATLNAETREIAHESCEDSEEERQGLGRLQGRQGCWQDREAQGAPRALDARARGEIAGAVGITAAIGIVLAKLDRRKAVGKVKGAASSVTGGRDYDDATLAHKVETELFRPADAPKGQVSVNVNDGVVELRGESQIRSRSTSWARAPARSAASRTSATCCTPARTAASRRAE